MLLAMQRVSYARSCIAASGALHSRVLSVYARREAERGEARLPASAWTRVNPPEPA